MGWKLGSFHLKGYTKKFYPQTEKLKLTSTKLNVYTFQFQSQTWMFKHSTITKHPYKNLDFAKIGRN